jgi:hypothetical protein
VGLFDRDLHRNTGGFLPEMRGSKYVFPEGKIHNKNSEANAISGMDIGDVHFLQRLF